MTVIKRLPGALEPVAMNRRDDRRPWILVVDDEPPIVDLLAIFLAEEGFGVIAAYDGQQAWECVRSARPDVILCDVMMPHLSGLELFDRIRASDELAGTPLILMSAGPPMRPDDGATFLRKPFDLDNLLDLVSAQVSLDRGTHRTAADGEFTAIGNELGAWKRETHRTAADGEFTVRSI